MKGFDLLSGAPKTLIFEKDSNKTNFGGVLTMIYLIVLLVIIITYMVDYAINPKYSVVYTYEHQFKADNHSINSRYNDKNLNPKITFNFKMDKGINESHFAVRSINSSTGEFYEVKFGQDYTENLYDMQFYVYYRCNVTNNSIEGTCDLYDDEINQNKNMNLYEITLNYTGFKVDHQNSENPLKKEYFQYDFALSIDEKMSAIMLRWKNIKYTEERGIAGMFDSWFGITSEFNGGSFMDPLIFNIEISESFKQLEAQGLKFLGLISMNKEDANNYYDLYSRTKKGRFDPIANICSLALTIYSGFIFVYCGFYSNNFDNYEIIEKILAKNRKKSIKMKNTDDNIEISDDLDKKDALLISSSSNNEEKITGSEKEKVRNNTNDINAQGDGRILPKLRFYDFLFNNFYMKKYCDSNKHNFLNICNEIVSKYNSVDFILYNQIRLENLFKDYKWNNPKLNDIENNKLITDLNIIN